MRLSYGLLGDLADCFPSGEIKQLLLANWVASELRSKHRMPAETRKTMRWAREVRLPFPSTPRIYDLRGALPDGEDSHAIDNSDSFSFSFLVLLFHGLWFTFTALTTCMQSTHLTLSIAI